MCAGLNALEWFYTKTREQELRELEWKEPEAWRRPMHPATPPAIEATRALIPRSRETFLDEAAVECPFFDDRPLDWPRKESDNQKTETKS